MQIPHGFHKPTEVFFIFIENSTLFKIILHSFAASGSMNNIKSEKLKDITTPSVENLLNGKVPGVYVAPGSCGLLSGAKRNFKKVKKGGV